jgi:multicomponent Na+:H+ antiporter subunit E
MNKVNVSEPNEPKSVRWIMKFTVIMMEFMILFIVWVLFSEHYQLRYLIMGLCASALVTYLTHDFLYNPQGKTVKYEVTLIFSSILHLVTYTCWLILAIIKANIQIAMIIIKLKMPIDPGFVKFETGLRRKVSLVTLANSITLTPGTITVELRNYTYLVHSLVRESAGDLETGLMQRKIGIVFSDNTDSAPVCSWIYGGKETQK